MEKQLHKIHFMGIGGSAISAAALLAKDQGFAVSGCDLQEDTPYLSKIINAGIPVDYVHDKDHLQGIDLLVVTPAVFFQDNLPEELTQAKNSKILMTWQEFLGKVLQKDKRVVTVTGTHGKSTTTALAALIFEKAGQDPNVIIGATVKEWNANYRSGKNDLFITEGDEFYDNFLNYLPETILLNNIEFDHPDYFTNQKQLFESFAKHIRSLSGNRSLIINQDHAGVKRLFDYLGQDFLKTINVYGYTLGEPLVDLESSLRAEIIEISPDISSFKVNYPDQTSEVMSLKIPGIHNIANSLGAIILSELYGIDRSVTKEILSKFTGIGRRLELIGEENNIKVYDDYAHHPTAIAATIEALRQKYPKNRLWAIVEPHSYSRTKALLDGYRHAFKNADKVIIAPIFKARDTDTFGISESSISDISLNRNITTGDFTQIEELIKKEAQANDVILVMGAGKSYQLARDILSKLQQ